MAQNRGELFEDQFKASMPPGVEVRKLATAGPRAQSLGQISEMLQRFARMVGQEVPGWAQRLLNASSHTPKQPYDMLVLAPAARVSPVGPQGFPYFGGEIRDAQGAPMWLQAQPKLAFALELKSAGSSTNIPFSRIKPHQEKGLAKAAARGLVAGLVVEFPDVAPDGEVYFLPIGSFLEYKRAADRMSLPLGACRLFGLKIEVDPDRGTVHRYWKVGEFLAHFGADTALPGKE